MEPPSYEEARLHPPALSSVGFNIPPPPSYDVSLHSPPTPPPTYGEAVTVQPDPFPVLTPPRVQTGVSSLSPNTGAIIHPTTQVGVSSAVSGRQTQPVVTQPQPVPVAVTFLRDVPAMVRCPYCHRVDTTKVTYLPGSAAWCMCLLITMMGLICGFCLIPFMVRSLQDAHHSCQHCGNHLHTYKR
ncbi:lipopolysaccharide-induced tumor necrosis factor-alpha factor homolog [Notolabrus celidotus]|uniref:lipopolysaccharide-induced tumor necrosis factor-alpha factor homolog n=1 Tax=Notolabrus celidotus TaxID=1203425 RepID=UPI0014905149|nr:lipopolysaccharide-induced tumor necrosis factor-alpha factor homolog [Notolabrus celidotus]XP_034544813.1 lipopolysaccharide-induced tumor necrosis factor-alpha factor homolog [Notolabrus celidotus]